MNKLILFLLLAATCAPSLAAAQQQVYDRYGKEQGKIEPDGRVYDRYGKNQGRIDPDGRIYDRYGKNVGRIEQNKQTQGPGSPDASQPAKP